MNAISKETGIDYRGMYAISQGTIMDYYAVSQGTGTDLVCYFSISYAISQGTGTLVCYYLRDTGSDWVCYFQRDRYCLCMLCFKRQVLIWIYYFSRDNKEFGMLYPKGKLHVPI